ncbi:Nucleoside-diphosphate-sugar epimerase [Hydrocarboniphaga daqingensis]|jgi:nucleoside-diphosphate-sugar epimerase|uniref:Nucleoside-diphosphate-sugar epimerase n=1 Tax=Hydrocarboniphaga daqingensis TaxID=490188 RepID=A0A1M5L9J2_9GAMM|nr:SDR family oxidoreductase [Hydrocarboniphaga daqingensis]SHG61093.1 Nucleoside-diphosphate-sugar epimerase [Hydrocarboniphaga daqingensis]
MKPGLDTSSPCLIVGCGDIGLRVGQRLLARGIAVHGQVRSADSAHALTAAGIRPLLTDLDAPAGEISEAHELVFWFAPPPPSGDGDPRLRQWLAQHRPRRLVYISTSGVYGDCDNRWIDESEPLKPQTARGKRRLDAERALADHADRHGTEVITLRVPGIYGPGRLPVDRLRAGLPVIIESESPTTNRIHADDLARTAIAAAECGQPGEAYNVSDGSPTTMTDYFCRCAALLGLPEPPRVSLAQARQTFTPAMLSFLEESKRLLTSRMRNELGVMPRYPDLATGLPSCLPAD